MKQEEASLTETAHPFLAMKGITKSFGPVTANQLVDLDLKRGEIHGLVGENGAGKTTLMNVLYGLYAPDQGEILIEGEPAEIASPHHAISRGIGMVHQHFMLVPTLTVIDNVLLGLQRGTDVILNRDQARERLLELAETYGLRVNPDAYIWQLSVGDRQRVEILKALYREIQVLILDEPSAVLTPQESEELFHTIRRLVQEGLSVIFITHHLEEALEISDRITVLRDGRVVGTRESGETDKKELANLMVGREVLFRLERKPYPEEDQPVILRVEDLVVRGDRDTRAVKGVSFEVRRGEIVGVAGVDGNGQSELVQALTGLRRAEGGWFSVNGRELTNQSPRVILESGVGHIPEDLDHSLIDEFSLIENLMLDRHYSRTFSNRGVLRQGLMEAEARRLIEAYDVRTPGETVKAGTLSGGNKQKLVVSREVSREPVLMIAAHPTRGLDIGAEEYVRSTLLACRQEGMAILLVSTKLDEILSLSDRILVMARGEIMGEREAQEADVNEIGLMMAGTNAP